MPKIEGTCTKQNQRKKKKIWYNNMLYILTI